MKSQLKDRINNDIDTYSRIQKKLAIFMVENWNEIPLMSIESISKETGVSTATITRFVRKFDFRGFYDFKEKIKGDLKESINPVERFKLLKGNLGGRESLVSVAKQDIKNINKLLATLKDETFQEIVGMLEEAKRVYTYGTSISGIFASLTAYLFNQVRKETFCLRDGNLSVEERILRLTQSDLILLYSFYPYSRGTVQYAQLAKSRGLNVVSISDNLYSPISEFSSRVLSIPRENVLFTTSTSAVSVLINAIATEIAVKRKDELTQLLNDGDEILKKFYFLS